VSVWLNPRHEKFAQLVAIGNSLVEAFVSVGYAKGNAVSCARRSGARVSIDLAGSAPTIRRAGTSGGTSGRSAPSVSSRPLILNGRRAAIAPDRVFAPHRGATEGSPARLPCFSRLIGIRADPCSLMFLGSSASLNIKSPPFPASVALDSFNVDNRATDLSCVLCQEFS
jgi:hypothetical protein